MRTLIAATSILCTLAVAGCAFETDAPDGSSGSGSNNEATMFEPGPSIGEHMQGPLVPIATPTVLADPSDGNVAPVPGRLLPVGTASATSGAPTRTTLPRPYVGCTLPGDACLTDGPPCCDVETAVALGAIDESIADRAVATHCIVTLPGNAFCGVQLEATL